MSEKLKEYARTRLREILDEMPIDERLAGISPKQLLEGISPRERREGLSPREWLEGMSPEQLRMVSEEAQRKLRNADSSTGSE